MSLLVLFCGITAHWKTFRSEGDTVQQFIQVTTAGFIHSPAVVRSVGIANHWMCCHPSSW